MGNCDGSVIIGASVAVGNGVDNGVEIYDAAVCVRATEYVISIIFSIGIVVSLVGIDIIALLSIKRIPIQQMLIRQTNKIALIPISVFFCRFGAGAL